MSRCTCATERSWNPTINPMHGGPFCQKRGRVLPNARVRQPITVIGEVEGPRFDRATQPGDAHPVAILHEDGVNYGQAIPLNNDGNAYILVSRFDPERA